MCEKLFKCFFSKRTQKVNKEEQKLESCPIDRETLLRTLSSLTLRHFEPCVNVAILGKSQWQYLAKYGIVDLKEDTYCAQLTEKGRYVYVELRNSGRTLPEEIHNLIVEEY